jgi:KUP system potassium uptake protein
MWLTFATLEGLYMTSALNKVPEGAWFTVSLAIIIATVFSTWRFGKEHQWRSERKGRLPRLSKLVKNTEKAIVLTEEFGGGEVTPMKGKSYFDIKLVLTAIRIWYLLRQGWWRRCTGRLPGVYAQI